MRSNGRRDNDNGGRDKKGRSPKSGYLLLQMKWQRGNNPARHAEQSTMRTQKYIQQIFAQSSEEFPINRQGSEVAAYRRPSVKRVDRLEESLYWLVSAAMLVYLLLGVISR
jgi:hypothetical protein